MFSSAIERLNERRNGAGEPGVDAGFTLIELMVVLLILAILLAIAIPTFLGVTGGANDRAAQSNLNTALTTVKAAASQNQQTYSGLDAATFSTNEPSISWVTGDVGSQGPVSVYVDSITDTGTGVVLASWSSANSGTCWYAVDNISTVEDISTNGPYAAASPPNVGTSAPTGTGTFYGEQKNTGSGACSAATAPTTASWGSSFSTIGS